MPETNMESPDRPVDRWASQYHNKNTRITYTSSVFAFLSSVYGIDREKRITPENSEKWESLAQRYLREKRDHTEDLISFVGAMSGRPPMTIRRYVSAVREWFIFNDLVISEKDQRRLRQKIPKGGALTIERDLDHNTIRTILSHLDLMMRSLILLLASSGMRIGEALQLKIDDIKLPAEGVEDIGVIMIRAEYTKTKQQRICFCSKEAAAAIIQWKKKRAAYLAGAQYRGKGLGIIKNIHDPRLFPFSDSVAGEAWESAVMAAGMHSRDPATRRLQLHPHMLRKFFSSQLSIVVSRDIVEMLMGHKGYLSDAYRRYSKKQIEEEYRKGEAYLSVTLTDELRELRTTSEKRTQALSEIMEDMIHKQIAQQKVIDDLTSRIQLIEQYPMDEN